MSIFFIVLFLLFLFTFAYAGWRGAPWVPTWKRDVSRFLQLADIKPGQTMIDLGCGDGRLLCAAASLGANAIGYEISLLPYVLAHVRRLFQKEKQHITIRYRDFWNVDLHDADVVYFFLMPDVYPKLKKKFEKELQKGARVIAYAWPIHGWQPVAVDRQEKQLDLYCYQR